MVASTLGVRPYAVFGYARADEGSEEFYNRFDIRLTFDANDFPFKWAQNQFSQRTRHRQSSFKSTHTTLNIYHEEISRISKCFVCKKKCSSISDKIEHETLSTHKKRSLSAGCGMCHVFGFRGKH